MRFEHRPKHDTNKPKEGDQGDENSYSLFLISVSFRTSLRSCYSILFRLGFFQELSKREEGKGGGTERRTQQRKRKAFSFTRSKALKISQSLQASKPARKEGRNDIPLTFEAFVASNPHHYSPMFNIRVALVQVPQILSFSFHP